MKTYRLIAIVVAMLFASPISAQSPNNAVWGVASAVRADSGAWLNAENQVFRWNSARSEFEQMPGSLKQISVGTDGEVWGVDPNDNVLRWTGSQWQVQGMKLKQLSVRNAQEVWGVNAANDFFRWTGSAWEPIPSKLAYVSVGVDGTMWGISSTTGGVFRRDGSTWTEITGIPGSQINRISVTNAQRVWVIDSNTQLFQTKGTGWEHAVGEYLDVAEAANGELWRLATNGTIAFNQNPTAPTQRMHYSLLLKQIAVGSASPVAPTPPVGSGLTAEQQQMLDAHNRERQNYPGVGALQWAPQLAQWAQEWAEGRAREGNINHRQNTQNNHFKPGEYIGENIFSSSRTTTTGADAVQWWTDEKQWYHYDQDDGMAGSNNQPPGCVIVRDSPACRARNGYCFCGHFTQVIWKNTQYVGCGKATAANGWVYFVCNYYPGGNITGQKPY